MPFIDFKEKPKEECCLSPQHNPPNMIALSEGIHTWQCPSCGQTHTFRVTKPICNKGHDD